MGVAAKHAGNFLALSAGVEVAQEPCPAQAKLSVPCSAPT